MLSEHGSAFVSGIIRCSNLFCVYSILFVIMEKPWSFGPVSNSCVSVAGLV